MSEKEPFRLKQASVRLVSSPPLHSSEPIDSPEAAIRVMGKELKNYDREVLAVVNLKTNLEPINFSIVSMGALNASIAEPREMMKNMFLSNAYGVILVHNHPSGRLVPSQEDVKITDRIQQLCSLAGINLMDHVIIGAGNDRTYYSMRENGEISMKSIRFKERPEDLAWQDLKAAEPEPEYHQMKLSELNGINSESKSFIPIYRHDAAYARVHGERDQYMQSRKENVNCADAIEKAVSDNFDGAHLNADAAKSVVEQFGPERVAYVLANTVQQKDWDGRFSPGTKKWAGSIETVPDIDGLGRDRREDFEVDSHPAVLDGFIDLARKEIDAAAVAQDTSVHESLHDYLIEKGVDAIEDDYDFMIAEFEAVTDWCVDHDYNLSPDDEAEICGRGLADAVEDAKFNWEEDRQVEIEENEEKPSVLEMLQEKKEEAAKDASSAPKITKSKSDVEL